MDEEVKVKTEEMEEECGVELTAECGVCRHPIPKPRVHYGGVTCYSCRAFFRRGVQRGVDDVCRRDGNCPISNNDRKQCPNCRMKKCLEIGMQPKFVLSEKEKEQRFRKRNSNQGRPKCGEQTPGGQTSHPQETQDQEEDPNEPGPSGVRFNRRSTSTERPAVSTQPSRRRPAAGPPPLINNFIDNSNSTEYSHNSLLSPGTGGYSETGDSTGTSLPSPPRSASINSRDSRSLTPNSQDVFRTSPHGLLSPGSQPRSPKTPSLQELTEFINHKREISDMMNNPNQIEAFKKSLGVVNHGMFGPQSGSNSDSSDVMAAAINNWKADRTSPHDLFRMSQEMNAHQKSAAAHLMMSPTAVGLMATLQQHQRQTKEISGGHPFIPGGQSSLSSQLARRSSQLASSSSQPGPGFLRRSSHPQSQIDSLQGLNSGPTQKLTHPEDILAGTKNSNRLPANIVNTSRFERNSQQQPEKSVNSGQYPGLSYPDLSRNKKVDYGPMFRGHQFQHSYTDQIKQEVDNENTNSSQAVNMWQDSVYPDFAAKKIKLEVDEVGTNVNRKAGDFLSQNMFDRMMNKEAMNSLLRSSAVRCRDDDTGRALPEASFGQNTGRHNNRYQQQLDILNNQKLDVLNNQQLNIQNNQQLDIQNNQQLDILNNLQQRPVDHYRHLDPFGKKVEPGKTCDNFSSGHPPEYASQTSSGHASQYASQTASGHASSQYVSQLSSGHASQYASQLSSGHSSQYVSEPIPGHSSQYASQSPVSASQGVKVSVISFGSTDASKNFSTRTPEMVRKEETFEQDFKQETDELSDFTDFSPEAERTSQEISVIKKQEFTDEPMIKEMSQMNELIKQEIKYRHKKLRMRQRQSYEVNVMNVDQDEQKKNTISLVPMSENAIPEDIEEFRNLDDSALLDMVLKMDVAYLEQLYTVEETNYLNLQANNFWDSWRSYSLGPSHWIEYMAAAKTQRFHNEFYTSGFKQVAKRIIAYFADCPLADILTVDLETILRLNLMRTMSIVAVFNSLWDEPGQVENVLGIADKEVISNLNFVPMGVQRMFSSEKSMLPPPIRNAYTAAFNKVADLRFCKDRKLYCFLMAIIMLDIKDNFLVNPEVIKQIRGEIHTIIRRYFEAKYDRSTAEIAMHQAMKMIRTADTLTKHTMCLAPSEDETQPANDLSDKVDISLSDISC